MPSIMDKLKKAVGMDKDKKPEPKNLGTGMAARAATAAANHNKQTEAIAKDIDHYKKGGKVKRTGPAVVHKNEHVLTEKQAKSPAMKKALKKMKKEPTVQDYRKKK